jgi:hypothetical protein
MFSDEKSVTLCFLTVLRARVLVEYPSKVLDGWVALTREWHRNRRTSSTDGSTRFY